MFWSAPQQLEITKFSRQIFQAIVRKVQFSEVDGKIYCFWESRQSIVRNVQIFKVGDPENLLTEGFNAILGQIQFSQIAAVPYAGIDCTEIVLAQVQLFEVNEAREGFFDH